MSKVVGRILLVVDIVAVHLGVKVGGNLVLAVDGSVVGEVGVVLGPVDVGPGGEDVDPPEFAPGNGHHHEDG